MSKNPKELLEELDEKKLPSMKEKPAEKSLGTKIKEKTIGNVKNLFKDDARFVAHILTEKGTERVPISNAHKTFFEYDNQKYYINYEKVLRNYPYEDKPVLMYRRNYSEPLSPTNTNEELLISMDMSRAVEGEIIERFRASSIDVERIEKYMKYLIMAVTGLGILVLYNIANNLGFIGG